MQAEQLPMAFAKVLAAWHFAVVAMSLVASGTPSPFATVATARVAATGGVPSPALGSPSASAGADPVA